MTTPDSKIGALTIQDLLTVWRSAGDKSYVQPLEAAGAGSAGTWSSARSYLAGETVTFGGTTFQAVGTATNLNKQPDTNPTFWSIADSKGLEVYTQLMAQLQRVSQGVDNTTQALYIRPWSGQSAPPAAGEAKATVALTLARTLRVDRGVRLVAGQVAALEVVTLSGDPGGVTGPTGRRYVLQQDVVFLPGESGPVTVQAIADTAGWGHNNPLPGTISAMDQPGTGFYNTLATITVNTAVIGQPPPYTRITLVTQNVADTIVPGHVGQYLVITASANPSNVGKIARIASFIPPNPTANVGSSAVLEPMAAFESTTVMGTFIPGELVKILVPAPVAGFATLVAQHVGLGGRTRFGLAMANGSIAVGNTLLGVTSGATATVDQLTGDPTLLAEVGTASWRVLDWPSDMGVTVTNAAQPAGGRLGYLDAIGSERNVPRAPGEGDDSYRARVGEVADVVTPNAIRRNLTRVLGTIPYCFREVGSALLPGFYFDRPVGDVGGDAYDTDLLLFNATRPSTTITSGNILAAAGPQVTFTVANAALLLGAKFLVMNTEVLYVLTLVGNTYTVQRGVMGTAPALHLTGDSVKPVFLENERVAFVDSAGSMKASGWFGKFVQGSNQLTMTRLQGLNLVVAAGDQILGLTSGTRYNVVSLLATVPDAFRFHELFDYASFRAFFLVGVPRLSFGEFGFAWGIGTGAVGNNPNCFLDIAPGPNFYDGYAHGAANLYGRVWAALNKAKAGGVGVDLYLTNEACV